MQWVKLKMKMRCMILMRLVCRESSRVKIMLMHALSSKGGPKISKGGGGGAKKNRSLNSLIRLVRLC